MELFACSSFTKFTFNSTKKTATTTIQLLRGDFGSSSRCLRVQQAFLVLNEQPPAHCDDDAVVTIPRLVDYLRPALERR